jgi:peptidoglycan/xylan/chitin deacetylase (PgdA/CDA1 family)
MKDTAKRYTQRCATLLRQGAARIDRRARWTLVPLLVIVILWTPIWSAAARFTSLVSASSDSLRVPILVYHSVAPTHPGQTDEQRLLDVDPAVFQRQMMYLAANKYTVIPLSTLVAALQGHANLPARAVVLTFDDGWLTQYQNALPILEQMHFTATFFVITRQVGMGPKYMGVDELKALQRAGMTIASHTRTHPKLVSVSDSQLHDEVFGSRQDLQKMLGITSDLFAYPYGSWNKRVEAAVQDAGYQSARAFGGGSWNDASDRFSLHSVPATDDMAAFERELGVQVVAVRPLRFLPR